MAHKANFQFLQIDSKALNDKDQHQHENIVNATKGISLLRLSM